MTNLANRLPDSQPPLSAAAFNARRDINRDKYATSGYIEPGKHYTGSSVFSYGAGGMWTTPSLKQAMRLGRNSVDGRGVSMSGNPIFHVDGLIVDMRGINWPSEENNEINIPNAPMAQVEVTTTTTRDYAQGDHVVVGNDIYVCLPPDGSSVGDLLSDDTLFEKDDAVAREDLVGMEVFLVELGDDDGAIDAVYPYGNVQYGAAAVDDQFSLSTNAMPQSYSAMYLGDTSTTGRGLKWSTLTPEQRNLWAQKSSNNIYIEDGKYYQWQYRIRVIPSRGGYWRVPTAWGSTRWAMVDTRNVLTDNNVYRYASSQGMALSQPNQVSGGDGYGSNYYLTSGNSGVPDDAALGVAVSNESVGREHSANGICYFISLAVVSRLNQGAYHPVYNPLGTGNTRGTSDLDGVDYSDRIDLPWTDNRAYQSMSVADCFNTERASTLSIYPDSGTLIGGEFRTGHPNNLYHDAVYNWQVDDLRMDAHGFDLSPDEFANGLIYGQQDAREPYKVMRLFNTTVESVVGGKDIFLVGDVLEENGLPYAYQGGGYIYNHDKDEFIPVRSISDGNGTITNHILKPGITPENIERYYAGSLQDTSVTVDWDAGDEVTTILYKYTHQYSGRLDCVDIMATPQRLIEVFNEYGIDRMFGATWIPELIGSNGSTGITCKARRWVVETPYTYHKTPAGSEVKTIHTSDFESVANETVIIDDSDSFIMLPYYTAATPLIFASFGYRLLDGEFGSVWATDNADPVSGGNIVFNATGKVPVSEGFIEANAYQIQRVGMLYSDSTNFDNIATGKYAEIDHIDIPYAFASDGVKFAPFFSVLEGRGLIYGQIMFKEVLAAVGDRDSVEIDVSSAVQFTMTEGERFRLKGTTGSSLEGKYLIALTSDTVTFTSSGFDGYTFNYEDGRIYAPDGQVWPRARIDTVNAMGDGGTIEVSSNMTIIQDIHGDDIRVGGMITRKPLGFLPKHKRRNNH